MKEIFEGLISSIARKVDVVLVTVIESSGSTPRGNGARMLMSKEGHLAGTVGGGMVEKKSEDLALEVLKSKEDRTEKFILTPNQVADIGMICGGNVNILFQYLPWDTPYLSEICEVGLDHLGKHQPCWFISNCSLDSSNKIAFYSSKIGLLGMPNQLFTQTDFHDGNYLVEKDKSKFFVDALISDGKVFVFGGGHVAQALVPILKTLDFYCVVFDDRPDFLTTELFPNADERICGDLENIADLLTITKEDYGIIMTRGHKFDLELEKQLLQTEAHYIGVMGSKRKVGTHKKWLQEEGYALEDIQKIHMPIGLKIMAETPAELAISVAGELIEVRAKKTQAQEEEDEKT